MRVLVTGAAGMLGSAVMDEARARGVDVTGPPLEELDVTDAAAAERVIVGARADWVIHCAGYTDVDGAESEPDQAMAVNAAGTANVACASAAAGTCILYVSTDYVFDGGGSRPYRPGDQPNPINAYGRSKLAGEVAVRESGAGWLIVRTSWLYGRGGRNFVDTILRLARERPRIEVVADQRGRPTWTASLAGTLLDLVAAGAAGVLHAADSGDASWYELALATLERAGMNTPVAAISSAELARPARRPGYSVLDTADTDALLGRAAPHWRTSLARYLGYLGA
ncbi:MAG: dTDP-4-dehydrorhamnose reductase [Gemmatimonadetes bacterium]|nr:dTDP-4-dehydrorhamnose reductase [Gemmatimonadota bacterium]